MTKLLLAAVMTLTLAACSTVPKNNAIDATSAAINSVSVQLERLEAAGLVGDAKEDDLQRDLLRAHQLLSGHAVGFPDSGVCKSAASKVECAELVLADVLKVMEGLDYE